MAQTMQRRAVDWRMIEADDLIREEMRVALARRKWTAAELGRRIDLNRQGISDLMTGKTGRIPPRLLQALEALDLELIVRPVQDAQDP